MRNYKKEYENYHSRPEQKIRRAARNAARKRFSNADPTLDVHHKDNNPLNNDLNNLSLVTQHYNRKEPRLREKKLKALKSKLTAALRQTENVQEGLTDPQELAKEIEWGVSPKNVDSRALSTKQKKQMKDIVKLMKSSKAPNWVSKFTQVYFTSDKLVQQRLKSAAKRGGMSPELMKKLFKEDMGSVTGPHIAGTGDDNTVHTRRKKKKKVERRISLIKGMTRK
jgi:type VI protein secretion system component VasA